MEIDLGDVPKLTVKAFGQSYDVKIPTVKEAIGYQQKLKKEAGEEGEAFLSFLVSLGLPLEVCEMLTIGQLEKLADGLFSASKKK